MSTTSSDRVWNRLMQDPAIYSLMVDYTKSVRESETARAKADPEKHKLSTVMEKSAAYRYWDAGTDGRGRKVWFCWTCHRNVAGYFLTWREVRSKTQVKRDRFAARKQRNAAQEVARKRQNAWIAKAES